MIKQDMCALYFVIQQTFSHVSPLFIFNVEQEKLLCLNDQLEQQDYVLSRAFRPYYDFCTDFRERFPGVIPAEISEEYDMLVLIARELMAKQKDCYVKIQLLEKQLRDITS